MFSAVFSAADVIMTSVVGVSDICCRCDNDRYYRIWHVGGYYMIWNAGDTTGFRMFGVLQDLKCWGYYRI